MTYFILSLSKNVTKPVNILALDSKVYKYNMTLEELQALDDLRVAYFEDLKYTEKSDLLVQPTFMISNEIKQLFSLYDEQMTFKGVQLFTPEQENPKALLYWVPICEQVQCLDQTTQFYDNGLLKKMVLNRKALTGKHIFRVKGIVESKIVISLAVAESLLRRDFYGIGLEKVEVVG